MKEKNGNAMDPRDAINEWQTRPVERWLYSPLWHRGQVVDRTHFACLVVTRAV